MYHALCPSLAPLCLPVTCLSLAFLLPTHSKFERVQVSFHLVFLLYQFCFAGALALLGRLKSSVSTSSFCILIFLFITVDFSDLDETGTDSHTALKIFACNFFKAHSSFLSYMSYCGLTGRISCFVNVSDKVWRVSACTACPSAEELPEKQHALEWGRKRHQNQMV